MCAPTWERGGGRQLPRSGITGVRSVINTRFTVDSGQARAANLAETVGSATPGNLLCRVYHRFSISWTLSADGDRDRFNTFSNLSSTRNSINSVLVKVRLSKNLETTEYKK